MDAEKSMDTNMFQREDGSWEEVNYDHRYEFGHVTAGYYYHKGTDYPTTGDAAWVWIEGNLPYESLGDTKTVEAWLGIEFINQEKNRDFVRFGCMAEVDTAETKIRAMKGYSDIVNDELRAREDVVMWFDTPEGERPQTFTDVWQPLSLMEGAGEQIVYRTDSSINVGCGGWMNMLKFNEL